MNPDEQALARIRNSHGIAMRQTGPYVTLRKDDVARMIEVLDSRKPAEIHQYFHPAPMPTWPAPSQTPWTVATSNSTMTRTGEFRIGDAIPLDHTTRGALRNINLPDGEGDFLLSDDDHVGDDDE